MVKREILKIVVAAIFALALLLPTATKFAHTLEGHEHKPCTDVFTHLHEKQLDCSICDFHFSLFNFTPLEVPEFTVFHSFQHIDVFYATLAYNIKPTQNYLRGPPQFS